MTLPQQLPGWVANCFFSPVDPKRWARAWAVCPRARRWSTFWHRRQQSLLPPIDYSVQMTLWREGRGGLGVQATKQHGACLLRCSVFLSAISFFIVVWFLGFDTPILVRTNATQKKLNCWINDVFYSTLCSTFLCWELIWYPKNQQNTGKNNTVLRIRTVVP